MNAVEERLDRAMANPAWHLKFPNATLHCLVAPVSDHHPILLSTENSIGVYKKRRFKFENRWLWEAGFKEVVSKCWRGFNDLNLCDKLDATTETLEIWGNKADSLFRTRKKELENNINHFQGSSLPVENERYKKAREELSDLLIQEEVYWRQRAKTFWLKEGDLNTRFFHQMCSSRKRRNKLEKLKDENGIWVEGQLSLCGVVKSYFQQIFEAPSNIQREAHFLDVVEQIITPSQNLELVSDFKKEEFRVAINQMHGDKAPGPNGFNPSFYQKCWSTVGDEVFNSCKSWLEQGTFPTGLNNTHVVLIPKCDNPQTMKDLRPISLCNVVYKILSKVLCNRLKRVLPGLVDKAQSAFISGRAIQDNILIAFETIHMMKNKRYGKKGDVALKIDISKAYDRVDWNYLEAILRRLGFCEIWIKWMLQCVRTVSYSFVVNGDLVGPLVPVRGLRQGDPLSPYLFILCAEGLSAAIRKANLDGFSSRQQGVSECTSCFPPAVCR